MNVKNVVIFFAATCVSLCLLSSSAFAQATDNGGLEGTVYDPNAAVVPNAVVTVKNSGTGLTRTVTANGEGRWRMAVLPLGTYEVRVEITGFSPTTQTATVDASVTNTVDIVLNVAGVNPNEVTISADNGEQVTKI